MRGLETSSCDKVVQKALLPYAAYESMHNMSRVLWTPDFGPDLGLRSLVSVVYRRYPPVKVWSHI